MRQPMRPSIEYNRNPVVWAAGVLFIGGLAVNFVLLRPGWLLPLSLLAGGVAAARSGFYQPAANNGALGVCLGMVLLTPILAVSRVTAQLGTGDTIELSFMTLVLVGGWLPIVFTTMIIGYLGAILVDSFRRRVRAPIGHQ